MSGLSDPPGIVAVAACALAVVALVWAATLTLRLRRLGAAQRTIIGAGGPTDLIEHAAGLQQAFEALHSRVEELAELLEARVAHVEHRLDGSIAYRSLVRYDAYGELGGHQSTTIALLDAEHNGVLISSIAHRETARVYCKQVVAGEGELELSPEEAEAVRLALAGEIGSRTLD